MALLWQLPRPLTLLPGLWSRRKSTLRLEADL